MTATSHAAESDAASAPQGSITRTANRASSRALGYLLGLAIAALWGVSFVLTKAVLPWIGPMSIAFMRWIMSAALLLAWVACRGRLPVALKVVRCDGLQLLWLGLAGITLFYALQNLAVVYTSATNAGILANFTSVFMVLIAVIWFGERLRPAEWLALMLAFAGAVLVSQGSGHFSLSGSGLRGDLLMLAATVLAAVYSMGSKRLTERYPADVIIALVAIAGAVMLLPLALGEGLPLALPLPVWGALLLLGLGAGALGNLWWLHLLSYMDGSRAGMVLFLVPLFSTLLAVTYLHEPLTPVALAGAALVLVGIAAMKGKP